MRVLACNSPYGQGGIGQHFAQLVEESRANETLGHYYAYRVKPGDEDVGRVLTPTWWDRALVEYTPLRWTPAWKNYVINERYDRQVAETLSEPMTHFMGFAGKSLHAFRKARDLGATYLELIAPNSHVENVARLHSQAAEDTGLTDTWLNQAQIRKTLDEYETADLIYVHSDYVRDTFLAAGIPAEKLVRTHLHVDSHFEPPPHRPDDDVFRVVYVGRLEATKGIPLLLKVFDRLDVPNKELTLVGGWSTRLMRKYLSSWLGRPDIRHAPGDPLPVLQNADVFVHPTYEDGFGYAPVEALASGVPVIVTEDTGMKEHVRYGENGFVVPTGNEAALLDRLHHVANHPMAQTHSLLGRVSPPQSTPSVPS